MPTDGTLLLEHMPNGNRHLVTALSVFFSFGAVLSAGVALLTIPQHSCVGGQECDVEQNQGWRYMLVVLGIIVCPPRWFFMYRISNHRLLQTLTMFIARILFFRLHESPRYLVHAGRPQEAIESLQLISKFNGSELDIHLEDVDDQRIVGAHDGTVSANVEGSAIPCGEASSSSPPPQDYRSTAEYPTALDGHVFTPTPVLETPPPRRSRTEAQSISAKEELAIRPRPSSPQETPPRRPRPPRLSSASSRRRPSFHEKKFAGLRKLPRYVWSPLLAWSDRVSMVLAPEWLRTTVLVWASWFSMSLGDGFFAGNEQNFLIVIYSVYDV
jgi:hypothetical protein